MTLTTSPSNTLNTSKRHETSMKQYQDVVDTIFNTDTVSNYSRDAFISAAKDGDSAKLESLLKARGEKAVTVDVRDTKTGRTAVHWAVHRGYADCVDVLLKNGADITLRDNDGHTPLELASHISIRSKLLTGVENGGNHRNLLQASWQGDINTVNIILKNENVNVNCLNSDGFTPLLLAVRDMNIMEKFSPTKCESLAVVRRLLQSRADLKATDLQERSIIHLACSSTAECAAEVVKYLLQHSDNQDVRDKRQFAAVHCAAQAGNTGVLKMILDCGAEANSKGYSGSTALHIAAINGHEESTKLLLNRGADVTSVDDAGHTPADVAKTKRIRTLLRQAWQKATEVPRTLGPVRAPSRQDSNCPPVKEKVSDLAKSIPNDQLGPLDAISSAAAAANVLKRQMNNVEKIKKVEEKLQKEIEDGIYPPLSGAITQRKLSTPSKILPNITILNTASSSPRKSAKIRFSPDTKSKDGTESRLSSAKKHGRHFSEPTPPSKPQQFPISVVSIDGSKTADTVRLNPVPPIGRDKRKLGHRRTGSDPISFPFLSYGQDESTRCLSKASVVTLEMEDECSNPLASASQILSTPIKKQITIDHTQRINERIPTLEKCGTPKLRSRSTEMRLVDLSYEFGPFSKESSPRTDDEASDSDNSTRKQRSHSMLLSGEFMIEKSRTHLQRQLSRSSTCSNSSSEGETTPRTNRSKKTELFIERRSLDRIPSARDEEEKQERLQAAEVPSAPEIEKKESTKIFPAQTSSNTNSNKNEITTPSTSSSFEEQSSHGEAKLSFEQVKETEKANEEVVKQTITADPAITVITKSEVEPVDTKPVQEKEIAMDEVDSRRKISHGRPLTVQNRLTSKPATAAKKTSVKAAPKAVSKKLEPIANKAILQQKNPKKSTSEEPKEQKKSTSAKPILKKETTNINCDKPVNVNVPQNLLARTEAKKSKPFEQYTSPVISDPFETIRQVQEKAAQVQKEKSKIQSKYPTRKALCPPSSAASKLKSKINKPSSASAKRKVTKDPPDAIQVTRPKSGKKCKKGRLKSASKKNKSLVNPKTEGVGFISGQGWHIQTGQSQLELAPGAVAKTVDQFSADDDSPRKDPNCYSEIEFKWDNEDNESERLSECGLELMSDNESEDEIISAEIVEKEVVFPAVMATLR